MNKDRDFAVTFLICALFCAAVVALGGIEWLMCKRQAEIYQSQGIDMTTWDVLMGMKPAASPARRDAK